MSEASDPNNVTGESNGEEEANTSSDNSKSFPDNKQQKLDVLTSSLMTLTQQKSKMETNWVAERKQYKVVIKLILIISLKRLLIMNYDAKKLFIICIFAHTVNEFVLILFKSTD